MKIGYSQNKNVKQLKQIIQTLSKEIPNDNNYNKNKLYLDEFNKICTNNQALELLNKRLIDMVPKDRIITYNIQEVNRYRDANYTSDTITFNLMSNGSWGGEYDDSGDKYQYKKAYTTDNLKVNLKSSDVDTSNGEWKNSIWLGNIDEGNTFNYTELRGSLPCYFNWRNRTGYIYFYEDGLYLFSNDWSFLTAESQPYWINFNGILRYKSYEDYSTRS